MTDLHQTPLFEAMGYSWPYFCNPPPNGGYSLGYEFLFDELESLGFFFLAHKFSASF